MGTYTNSPLSNPFIYAQQATQEQIAAMYHQIWGRVSQYETLPDPRVSQNWLNAMLDVELGLKNGEL